MRVARRDVSGFVDSIEGVFPLTKTVLFGLAAAELTPRFARHYDAPAIASEIERTMPGKEGNGDVQGQP